MDYALIFIFGLVIGSFLNVCIYRIPKDESISYPPSHCINCNYKLSPMDLIPLFSYIFLKGKCKYCKAKISIMYPLIEILNAMLYLILYLKIGFTLITLKYFILVSVLIVIAIIDYKTQFVYTYTTIFGSVVGVIFIILQALIYRNGTIDLLLGGIVGFGIIWLIVFITRAMGEGDIEIAAVCGLFLGVKAILLGLFLAIILGGIVGIIILLLKLKKGKEKIAFGPCIAVGSFISMLWGNEMLNYYFNLLI